MLFSQLSLKEGKKILSNASLPPKSQRWHPHTQTWLSVEAHRGAKGSHITAPVTRN